MLTHRLPPNLRTAGRLFFIEVALLNMGVGWIYFWGLVIRLHYLKGDMANAMLTASVFVVPVIIGLGWHIGRVCGLNGRVSATVPRPLSG